MRIPLHRFLAVLLAGALVAAACADDPNLQGILDDAAAPPPAVTIEETPEPQPPEEPAVPPADSSTPIPPATAPDPDPTPLPVDADFRIGTLANGLTYMLRSNDTPGGSLDLRLVVDAGSLQQPDGTDGSAHFLEHMMFNGTEAFPGNELTTQLQRLGIDFGADINAYTSYDETVFLLEAPTFDPESAGVAFDVLAEWASRATIDPADVADEIGVVRDELRQGRETVDGIVLSRFEEIYTQGTPYENRGVIGAADEVEGTTASTLRAFYDDWYRPDNMAVVVVGDLSLDDMETAVMQRFSALEARSANSPPREQVTIALDPAPVVEVITQPDNGTDYLSLDIRLPVWDTATVGGERMTIIEEAVASMLDSRLGEAFQRGDLDLDQPPFIHPFTLNRGLRYYGMNLQAPALDTGLEQFMGQLLRAALDGFSNDDVLRMKEVLLSSLDSELSGIDSTQDSAYAGELTSRFLEGGAIDDAANRIRRQRAVIERLEADELTNFWRWILESSGPIVIEVGDDAADMPNTQRLSEVLDNVRPAAAAASAETIDELMPRPEPAATTDRRTRDTFEGPVEEWTFENGVVVSFQQTTITEGSFDIWLESSGGWSALDDPDSALAGAAVDAIVASGVGAHDTATVERYLESRDIRLAAGIDETEESIRAGAATSDAEALFALLNLTMTQPRVDDVAFRSAQRRSATLLEAADTDPDLRLSEAFTELLYGGDPRYDLLLDQNDIDALDPAVLLSIFRDRFGTVDDLNVAIVGDIDADTAFDLAARYLGTLPRGEADSWVDLGVEPPSTSLTDEIVLSAGTANGGLARIDVLPGRVDGRAEVTSAMLSTIISNRITDTIREALGASYGGFANISINRSGVAGLTSFIQVDGDPERLDEIRGALDAILLGLSTSGPTADEFDRAFQVIANDFNFVSDALFLTSNLAATRFPEQDALQPDDRFAILDSIGRNDIRGLAAALYADPASVEVSKVLP
jgi:zinc protease